MRRAPSRSAWSARWWTRPRRCPRRSRKTRRPPWPRPSAHCGARWRRGSPTPARRAPPSSPPCGATPTKKRARAPSPRSARRTGSRSADDHECDRDLDRDRDIADADRGGAVTYPTLDTLLLERHGPVGWLINNRPDRLNAMNSHMRDEFETAWRTLDADPEVIVIVHTGEGRAFQTGVDVMEIAEDGIGFERYRESTE